MDKFVSTISENPYLNALAIIVTISGALIFLWSNRSIIARVVGVIWRMTLGRFVTSLNETYRHTKMSIRYERYLIAVVGRHFAVSLLSIWFFALVRDGIRSVELEGGKGGGFYFSLVILANVLAFVVGSRLFDVVIICRNIVEAHDALEKERDNRAEEPK